MSPWTALLQSLHSAFIDEVTDRHPEPKPELGLPKKLNSFQFPSPQASKLFWVKTVFPGTSGAVLIAYETGFFVTLGLDARAFWELIAERAQGDFKRRAITPEFSHGAEFSASDHAPAELVALPRIVWMPIVLPEGACWFGIGA